MGKILVLMFGFLCFFSKTTYCQSESSKKEELCLAVPSVNEKNINEIESKLKNIPGVSLIGYCDQYKIFLIEYSLNENLTSESIARSVEDLNPRYKTEIKYGTPISKLINSCTKYSITVKPETK